jgi:hypothetical protein
MSRMVCPVCEKPVRRVDAKFCPHCGVAFKGNWPGATSVWFRWLFLVFSLVILSIFVPCLAPIFMLLSIWVGLVLYDQQLTPVLAQPLWKLWLRDVFLAAILAFLFSPVIFIFCAHPGALNDQLNDPTAFLTAYLYRVYRNLAVGWLLWIVLTASYYLLLLFRTGGKRRLISRERFVALFCAFVVVFWGFMLLGLKKVILSP